MGNDRSQLTAGWARLHLTGVTPDKAGLTVRFRQDESISGAGTTASPLTLSRSPTASPTATSRRTTTRSRARRRRPGRPSSATAARATSRSAACATCSAARRRCAQDRDLFTVEAATSAARSAGTFSSNNALLQRIFRNSNYAQWNNYVHKPNDTPTREKNGWTGDGWADSDAGLLNTDVAARSCASGCATCRTR